MGLYYQFCLGHREWKRSVSSTKSPPARWHASPEIGAIKCAPWPFLLWAEIIGILVTSHTAGDAPLPWHMPCVRTGSSLPSWFPAANPLESPYPVRRKNSISGLLTAAKQSPVPARRMIRISLMPWGGQCNHNNCPRRPTPGLLAGAIDRRY